MNPVASMDTDQIQSTELKRSCSRPPFKSITREELDKKLKAGEAIQIVNILDIKKYNLGFIKGSKKIPLDKLEARLSDLDQSRPVVTYCENSDYFASKCAAERLAAKGFDVCVYEGGIKEWKESGFPIDA